jgi:hypothetical protein
MNLYAAIRWLSGSECPLSGAYGNPGERFVLIEASSAHGTGASVRPSVRACLSFCSGLLRC